MAIIGAMTTTAVKQRKWDSNYFWDLSLDFQGVMLVTSIFAHRLLRRMKQILLVIFAD